MRRLRDLGHFEHSSGQFVAISRLFLGLAELVEGHPPAVVGRADLDAVAIVGLWSEPDRPRAWSPISSIALGLRAIAVSSRSGATSSSSTTLDRDGSGSPIATIRDRAEEQPIASVFAAEDRSITSTRADGVASSSGDAGDRAGSSISTACIARAVDRIHRGSSDTARRMPSLACQSRPSRLEIARRIDVSSASHRPDRLADGDGASDVACRAQQPAMGELRRSQRRSGARSQSRTDGPRSPTHRSARPGPDRDQIRFFSSCMFSPRPRISLVRTSKLAGVPASSVFSPLTMLS